MNKRDRSKVKQRRQGKEGSLKEGEREKLETEHETKKQKLSLLPMALTNSRDTLAAKYSFQRLFHK